MPNIIYGVGSCLPANILTNKDLEKIVDTSDEWIVQRTGIKQRYIVGVNETTSSLGKRAAEFALQDAGISKDEIDLIIVATSTPDNTFPATATKIQRDLGIERAVAFDIQAVCSGFIFALSVADKFLQSGSHKAALVIGSDTFSKIVDWRDRSTCVLFGDGAGAVVLKSQSLGDKSTSTSKERGVLTTRIYSDGQYYDKLFVDGGPSLTQTAGYLRMVGRDVFKYAIDKSLDVIDEICKDVNIKVDDIDWLVPHQANKRIIDTIASKLNFPLSRVVSVVSEHGNTSAASIPLALAHAKKNGRIKINDLICLVSLGAGFTWGSAIIRW